MVGGYNPVNWNAGLNGFVVTPADADRTAFIFNLNTGVQQRQRLGNIEGQYQTYNANIYGPAFGGGFDLEAPNFTYANPYTYGDGVTNIFGFNGLISFTPITLETYSIAAANPVPEPATFGLAGASLLALGLFRRRRVKATAAVKPALCVMAALLTTLPLSASSVVSGGTLLSQSNADQLASWLGEGDLLLTNVYSGAATAANYPGWHTTVDPYARTFTLISTNLGLVGGYNPVNWDASLGYYVLNPTDAGRTAFLFNLNTGVQQQQRLGTGQGQYQAYHYNLYGPAFGGGHDLALANGFSYANAFTYGDGVTNIFGSLGYTSFTPFTFETFSIAAANPVPEPATFGLASAALLALGMARRRRHAGE
ncbi:MAG: PEP_CTERM-anchored TLD domain-containing protein [Bryobacterales bacterium]|nr:PEP_CTERM-anchored TLD domain-containing protein [Bryobacterales bacterium]